MKYRFPSKFSRSLALILVLILITGVIGCSQNDAETFTCSVASDWLSVHKSSSSGSRIVGQLPMGLEVEILEQKDDGSTTWGRIGKMTLPDGTDTKAGWIDLRYVHMDGADAETETDPVADPTAEPTVEPTDAAVPMPVKVTVNMGTVTANKLNVRADAGSEYDTVGAYYQGDRIEIQETKTVADTVWGRTNLGWIGMGYVRMDGTAPATVSPDLITNGNTEVLGYGVVDLRELNVRTGPDTTYDVVRTVTQGTRFAYYQISTSYGNWARIEDGWVNTDYFYIEGGEAEDAISGTVTTDDLNIRTGPGTNFSSCGTFKKDDTVEVLAQVGAWGYTESGWVYMTYIQQAAPVYYTGLCHAVSGLNIRQEPNADSEILGTYTEGEAITVLEVKDGWGRTDKGWINLKYVAYDTVG